VVALDISPSAIEQARAAGRGLRTVDFRVANIMEYDLCAEGPWDLVVMSETIYYLGWLYPFFDLAWLASQIFAATRGGGRFLLANTLGRTEDHLLLPWIIRTYRDLFLNVGYVLEREELSRGVKNGVHFEVLISLFTKAPEETATDATQAYRHDAIQAIMRE
jgi:SAM-dependent methyltransferase